MFESREGGGGVEPHERVVGLCLEEWVGRGLLVQLLFSIGLFTFVQVQVQVQ